MSRSRRLLFFAIFLLSCQKNVAPTAIGPDPIVIFETTSGSFSVRLFAAKAPLSSQNVLAYVNAHFYDGTIFHRVLPGYVVQGGGFSADLKEKKKRAPIKSEATNGLINKLGTVALARDSDINSATSEFFININDNTRLNHKGSGSGSYGYAVFGEVVDGIDTIATIAGGDLRCPADAPASCWDGVAPALRDLPKEPVVVLKAYVRP